MSVMWKTREGRLLKIKDMASEHIRNCIAMLKRNRFKTIGDLILRDRAKIMQSYLAFLPPRTDAATDCFKREFDYWMENWNNLKDTGYSKSYLNRKLPILVSLKRELARRVSFSN